MRKATSLSICPIAMTKSRRLLPRRVLWLLQLWLVAAIVQATASDDGGDSLLEASSYDGNGRMSQYSLGQFQIDLSPTPELLMNVDNVVGPAIERIVRNEMERLFPTSFEYMYVANVQAVFQSSQSDETRSEATTIEATGPSNRIRERRQRYHRRQRFLQETSEPTTSIVYNGGVVAFDAEPSTDVTLLIQSTIETSLKDVLVADGGPWAFIQRVTYMDLSRPPPPPPTSTVTSAPSVPEISAVQDEEPDRSTTVEGENRKTPPELLGGFLGIALVLSGIVLFVRHNKRRTQNQEVTSALDQAETSSQLSGSQKSSRNGKSSNKGSGISSRRLSKASSSTNSNAGLNNYPPVTSETEIPHVFEDNTTENGDDNDDEEEEDGDRSEMAHYGNANSIGSNGLGDTHNDNASLVPSVASSEWTMVTSDEGTIGGSTIGPSSGVYPSYAGSRAAAMAYASSETFERDRLVTLQKDMMQSEWTHVGVNALNVPTASLTPPSRPIMAVPKAKSSGGLSFQQAHGGGEECGYEEQGEEVYLMPITQRTSTSDSDDSVDGKDGFV